MGIAEKLKDTIGGITSTADEYKNLGKEYQAKANQDKTGPTTPAPVTPAKTARRYGSDPGEQRIDVSDMLKKLPSQIPSYEKGVKRVPKTGLAFIHKDEAVIPKEQNMNAADAVSAIAGKSAKPKKEIKHILTRKSHDGKIIHTHVHHHPEHHPDEEHVSMNNADVANHFEAHNATPNEGEAPAEGAAQPAQMMASPSPAPAPAGM